MLHGTLPRAYFSPRMSYFGSYYGDDLHPAYPGSNPYISLEEPYPRLGDHRVLQSTWEAAASFRSVSPSPLDLSLKTSSYFASEDESSLKSEKGEVVIEVDDDEDRKDRIKRRLSAKQQESIPENIEPSDPVKAESFSLTLLPYTSDLHQKYQFPSQKLLANTSYQQQLMMTPQRQSPQLHGIHAPMTPPSTPSPPQCPRRRAREEEVVSPAESSSKHSVNNPGISTVEKISRPKKKHAARRLKFDEDTSSPVSGTVILGPDEAVVTGDIDPAFNVVEITEEARAEIAKIENRLGPYQCKLCRQLYDDAFQLAQHRCSRIAHVEYRCPECDKRFSCPANLASHRRWHKPRVPAGSESTGAAASPSSSSSSPTSSCTSSSSSPSLVSCNKCDAKFTRQIALRKHLASQHSEANNHSGSNNNDSSVENNNVGIDGAETAKEMTEDGSMIQQFASGTETSEVA